MKKGLLITALVILGIGAAGVGIGLALTKGNFKAFDRHEYVTNEVEFEGEITNLKIDEHVSALEIVETEDTKTKIVLKEIADHKHTVTLNEGTLSISEADWNLGFFDWFCGIGFRFGIQKTHRFNIRILCKHHVYNHLGIQGITGTCHIIDTGKLSSLGI